MKFQDCKYIAIRLYLNQADFFFFFLVMEGISFFKRKHDYLSLSIPSEIFSAFYYTES